MRCVVCLRGVLDTGIDGLIVDGIGSRLSFPFRVSLTVDSFGVRELGEAIGFKTADVPGILD